MAESPPRRTSGEGLEQTGYRVTSRIREELVMAQAFRGYRSLQAVIDAAVGEFLARMRKDTEGFAQALEHAERHRQSLGNGQETELP